MPAAPTVNRYQPSFHRHPIQNARTGFKPVYLPVILVVPYRRTSEGTTLPDTDVFNVRFYIAEAPQPSKVAGPFNTALLVPQSSQYEINLSTLQVRDTKINLNTLLFYDSSGNTKNYSDAVEGDIFEYTLAQGDIKSTVVYYPDADYYDMSRFSIDVEDLPRPQRYYFVWEAQYYKRVILNPVLFSEYGEFCIDKSQIGLAQFRIIINHPGEVHHEMFRKTPPFYFDNEVNKGYGLSESRTLELYRPFADLLQDIFDEQGFLNGINHINNIPAQLIPYLAYLIGWDLPNYPGVTDSVRRSVLRHAVYLQKLKGSKRAIYELFEIFGFTINIINLWYSRDGTRLISPEDNLPASIADQAIVISERCQIDPLVVDYSTVGFGVFEVPLIYKASGNITVSAWLVSNGPTRNALNSIVEDLSSDPDSLESTCGRTSTGYQTSQVLSDKLPSGDSTVVATSEVYVDFDTGLGTSVASSSNIPLINDIGVVYDSGKNIVKIKFDHYLGFENGTKVFLFASYPTEKVVVPEFMSNLRSNRFDIRIFLPSGEEPPTELFEFLLNFVFRLKAFHSLLRKVIFTIDLLQVYNVQDWCFGEGSQLQTLPPIIPQEFNIEECNEQVSAMGYKESDLALRTRIFNALVEEFKAWKSLDNTHGSGTDLALEGQLNVPINRPIGTECQFTSYGQNRVVDTPGIDFDHNEDTRDTFCDADAPPIPGSCFKGRVKDNLIPDISLVNWEIWRCTPCRLNVGSGSYWLFPTYDWSISGKDGYGSYKGQHGRSFLGSKIRQYNHPLPYSLHYTNRPYLFDELITGDKLLAYQRPSLEIMKDNLGFPGHRFITGYKLENDFVHPDYVAKPWYDESGDLNAKLTSDGVDEHLSYDVSELRYVGNGLVPDVSSFGSHEDRDFFVTHKVYVASASHPAIALDDTSVAVGSEESISFDSNSSFGWLFDSYNPECQRDYIDGYPAEYGWFSYSGSSGGSGSEVTSVDLLLFTFGSQILLSSTDYEYQFYRPYRFDCDCNKYPCAASSGVTGGVTGGTSTFTPIINVIQCRLDPYRQPDGTYDFNCDQLSLTPKLLLSEELGICSTRFDSSIPNSMCLLTDAGYTPVDLSIGSEGSVRYKDDYGVIHESTWVYVDNIMDIYTVTKLPHVWGEPDTGYVKNGRVYRRGIITTTRQIIRVESDGSPTIRGEGSTQEVGYFQTNVVCGDVPYIDDFCFHFDCMVTDEVRSMVVCGTRWVDCQDDMVEWPHLSTGSGGSVNGIILSGKQPFQWVNVWGNDESGDITAVCLEEGTEEFTELTYVGNGGRVPLHEDGSGVWPYDLPNHAFVSEMIVDIDSRVMEFVSVQLYGFYHTFSGDLQAVLTAPSGISIVVFHRPGFNNINFGNFGNFDGDYRFVNRGFTLLPDFGEIAEGTYRRDVGNWVSGAAGILSNSYDYLQYTGTKGTWKLSIYDWESGDIGTLDSWAITFKVLCEGK